MSFENKLHWQVFYAYLQLETETCFPLPTQPTVYKENFTIITVAWLQMAITNFEVH